jgi:hypothetical protein
MKKETYLVNLAYTFDPTHSGAHYTINGKTYMNAGELCECLAKAVLGYEPVKDANTRNDMGHDIPELNASVKSYNCSLSSRKDLGTDRYEYLRNFFATELADTQYIWVVNNGETVDLWYMDENEFLAFILACASWDPYNCKWRFKMCTNKTNRYLEDRLCA